MFRQFRKWFIWNFILFFLTAEVTYSLTGEEALKRFFEYFKTDDPSGIPVVKFEDPMELYSPLELYPMTLFNGLLLGHSQLKFQPVSIDLLSLNGTVKVNCPRLEMFGDYEWPSFFYTSEGFMNATIEELIVRSNFTMMIDLNDSMKLTDIKFHQESEAVNFDLTNLIWEHEVIVSSGAVQFFFDEIAIAIFEQLRPFLMSEANREISKFTSTLPPSKFLFPLTEKKRGDETVEEKLQRRTILLLNRLFQYLGLDPLLLPDLTKRVLGVQLTVTQLRIVGFSSISQLKKMHFRLQHNKIYVEYAMKYPHLILSYNVNMKSRILSKLNSRIPGKWNRRIAAKLNRRKGKQLNNVYLHMRLTLDPGFKQPATIDYLDFHVERFGRVRNERKNVWDIMSNTYDKAEDSLASVLVDALQPILKKILQKQLDTFDIENELLYFVRQIEQQM